MEERDRVSNLLSNAVDRFRAQIASLSFKLTVSRAQLRKSQAKVRVHDRELAVFETRIAANRKARRTLDVKLLKAEAEAAKALQANEELLQLLDNAKYDLGRERKALEALRQQHAHTLERLTTTNNERQKYAEELMQTTFKLETTSAAFVEASARVETLQSAFDDVKERAERAETEAQQKGAALQELSTRFSSVEGDATRKLALLKRQQDELTALRLELKNARSQISDSQQANTETFQQHNELRERMESVQDELVSAKTSLEEFREKWSEGRVALSTATQANVKLRKNIGELEETLKRERIRTRDENATAAKRISSIAHELDGLRKKLRSKETALAATALKHARVVDELSEISRRNTQLDGDLQSALIENAALTREKQVTLEKLDMAEGINDVLRSELAKQKLYLSETQRGLATERDKVVHLVHRRDVERNVQHAFATRFATRERLSRSRSVDALRRRHVHVTRSASLPRVLPPPPSPQAQTQAQALANLALGEWHQELVEGRQRVVDMQREVADAREHVDAADAASREMKAEVTAMRAKVTRFANEIEQVSEAWKKSRKAKAKVDADNLRLRAEIERMGRVEEFTNVALENADLKSRQNVLEANIEELKNVAERLRDEKHECEKKIARLKRLNSMNSFSAPSDAVGAAVNTWRDVVKGRLAAHHESEAPQQTSLMMSGSHLQSLHESGVELQPRRPSTTMASGANLRARRLSSTTVSDLEPPSGIRGHSSFGATTIKHSRAQSLVPSTVMTTPTITPPKAPVLKTSNHLRARSSSILSLSALMQLNAGTVTGVDKETTPVTSFSLDASFVPPSRALSSRHSRRSSIRRASALPSEYFSAPFPQEPPPLSSHDKDISIATSGLTQSSTASEPLYENKSIPVATSSFRSEAERRDSLELIAEESLTSSAMSNQDIPQTPKQVVGFEEIVSKVSRSTSHWDILRAKERERSLGRRRGEIQRASFCRAMYSHIVCNSFSRKS